MTERRSQHVKTQRPAAQTTTTMSESYDRTVDLLQKATAGFDHLFSDEIIDAKSVFQKHDESSFHLLGLGVCSFLEASLGMEVRPRKPQSCSCYRSRPCQVCIDDRGEYCVGQRRGTGKETAQGCIKDQQGYPQIPTRHSMGTHPRRLCHTCWLDSGFEVIYPCLIIPQHAELRVLITSESYMGYLQCL